jgi:hypothetical protein
MDSRRFALMILSNKIILTFHKKTGIQKKDGKEIKIRFIQFGDIHEGEGGGEREMNVFCICFN